MTEKDLDAVLFRALKMRFRLGLFDPIEDQPYWHVPPEAVRSDVCRGARYKQSIRFMFLLHSKSLQAIVPYCTFSSIPLPHSLAVFLQENVALAKEATAQGFVLLQNPHNILPLKVGQTLAVIGPHAKAQGVLLGNYIGQICPGNNTGDFTCVQTPLEAISALNKGGSTIYAQVCEFECMFVCLFVCVCVCVFLHQGTCII